MHLTDLMIVNEILYRTYLVQSTISPNSSAVDLYAATSIELPPTRDRRGIHFALIYFRMISLFY